MIDAIKIKTEIVDKVPIGLETCNPFFTMDDMFKLVDKINDSVIKCGECIFFNKPNCTAYDYMNQYTPFDETGFCSDGERKEIKH